MELIGLTWVLIKNSEITKVNNKNICQGVKSDGIIDWE